MEGPDTIRRRKRQRRIRAMEVPLDEGSCAVGHKGKEVYGIECCSAGLPLPAPQSSSSL